MCMDILTARLSDFDTKIFQQGGRSGCLVVDLSEYNHRQSACPAMLVRIRWSK